MIYAVHKIQKAQKHPEFLRFASGGLNLSLLVLMRAKFLNSKVRNCLERKMNVFRLSEAALSSFYQSEHAPTLLNYVIMNEKGLSDHLVLLLRRCKENKIELTCRNLISKEVDEGSVIAAVGQEIGRFLAQLPSEAFPDKTLNRVVVLLRALCKILMNIDGALAYTSPPNSETKFNWNRLYYIFERASLEELRAYV